MKTLTIVLHSVNVCLRYVFEHHLFYSQRVPRGHANETLVHHCRIQSLRKECSLVFWDEWDKRFPLRTGKISVSCIENSMHFIPDGSLRPLVGWC